jgi:aspartate/tyrosine/aromatic aminotransferase
MVFIKESWEGPKTIHVASPSRLEHRLVAESVGLEVSYLPYYDADKRSLDGEAFLAAVEALPRRSILLLQDVATDPTGLDLTRSEWIALQETTARRQHLTVFDSSHIGLASGEVVADASALRLFMA